MNRTRLIVVTLVVAAIGGIAVLNFSNKAEQYNAGQRQAEAVGRADSLNREASRLIDRAVAGADTAVWAGDDYLRAYSCLAQADSLWPNPSTDSLMRELRPCLMALRRTLQARMAVVEGMPAAERPLAERIDSINAILSRPAGRKSL